MEIYNRGGNHHCSGNKQKERELADVGFSTRIINYKPQEISNKKDILSYIWLYLRMS
jgi:hypothetical protein